MEEEAKKQDEKDKEEEKGEEDMQIRDLARTSSYLLKMNTPLVFCLFKGEQPNSKAARASRLKNIPQVHDHGQQKEGYTLCLTCILLLNKVLGSFLPKVGMLCVASLGGQISFQTVLCAQLGLSPNLQAQNLHIIESTGLDCMDIVGPPVFN